MIGTIKTVFIGESNTGKTSIVYRLMKNEFYNNSESTIGASFMTLKFDDISYQIWDTAGQERYNCLIPMYCKNAELIFFVFDVSNPESINRLDFYIDKLNIDLDKNVRFIIVGNKLDLVKGDSHIVNGLIDLKLEKFSKLKGRTDYINISAKSGLNCDILVDKMKSMGQIIVKNKPNDSYNNIITLTYQDSQKPTDDTCRC